MSGAARRLAILAACASLSGCQHLLRGPSAGPGSAAAEKGERKRPVTFAQRSFEAGRAHLRGGRFALAVDEFICAMLDDALVAEATNGLAVAHAGLGRSDLAERYFLAAMRADRGNPRYAANLARLYEARGPVRRPPAPTALAFAPTRTRASSPPAERRIVTANAVLTVGVRPATTLERVTAHEVRVAVRAGREGPVTAYATAAAAALPVVRSRRVPRAEGLNENDGERAVN